MEKSKIENAIRTIPDFPKSGIQFRDITTLLLDNDAFRQSINILYEEFRDSNIDVIVGVESRGFIFASPLSLELRCALAIARKPGKLPEKKISVEYDLEYGKDIIEMHHDAIKEGDRVLIVDDLLATGGTAKATGELVRKLKGEIVSFAFLIKLNSLRGEDLLKPNKVYYIIDFD